MEELDPDLLEAIQAHEDGRYDDALRCLQAVTGRVLTSPEAAKRNGFMTMFHWKLLTEAYGPARDALARVRDEQAARVLDGDFVTMSATYRIPGSRFHLVAHLDEMLGDVPATAALFARLEALAPEQAARDAHAALPALVQAGDFTRAERYLPRNPLDRLNELNALALDLPLFPPDQSAPRLAAELSNFVKDVQLRATTREGLGRDAEAHALRAAALAGLASEEMRALAERELAEPGSIRRELVARHMAREAAGAA
jgi:hypothetical protein